MILNEMDCSAAGLNIAEIKRIARGLSRLGKEAEALGIIIFVDNNGEGTLRYPQKGVHSIILAEIDGRFRGE